MIHGNLPLFHLLHRSTSIWVLLRTTTRYGKKEMRTGSRCRGWQLLRLRSCCDLGHKRMVQVRRDRISRMQLQTKILGQKKEKAGMNKFMCLRLMNWNSQRKIKCLVSRTKELRVVVTEKGNYKFKDKRTKLIDTLRRI